MRTVPGRLQHDRSAGDRRDRQAASRALAFETTGMTARHALEMMYRCVVADAEIALFCDDGRGGALPFAVATKNVPQALPTEIRRRSCQ